MMKDLEINKFFALTVIGGGLTGQLMVSLLLKNKFISPDQLCWINLNAKRSKDNRVSFLNTKNFHQLRYNFKYYFNDNDFLNIHQIMVIMRMKNHL